MLALVAVAMRIEWAPHAHAARERMREGIDFLARDRELAPVVGIVFLSLLLMTATPAAALFFATEDLHMGDAGFGILMAVWGAGMALGALVVAPRFSLRRDGRRDRGGRRRPGARHRRAGRVADGAGWRSPATCSAASPTGPRTCCARTLIHVRAPERLRGRAFAAFNGLRNGAELVALTLGGLAISALGARWTLVYAGAVPLLTAVVGLLWMRARVRVAVAQTAPAAA